MFENICNHIEAHLHELTPTRPLIVPMTSVIITTKDFNEVAGNQTLGAVLADCAEMTLVVEELATIATMRCK